MRASPAFLLSLVLLAPGALAHAGGPEVAFDPLLVEMPLHLHGDGAMREAAPAAADAVPLPPGDATAPSPGLAFEAPAPVRFQLGGGVDVTLRLVARQAFVARGADGDSLELALLLDGVPVEGATARVAFASPLLAPGDEVSASAVLQAPGPVFEKGQRLGLAVRPLMPALPEGALAVVVGENASRAHFRSMRVPGVADLELQEAPLMQYLAGREAYANETALVRVVPVTHDAVDLGSFREPDRPVVLVFEGAEPHEVADAHATPYRDRRVEWAHELLVGETLVRVHPGVGVVVPLGAGPGNVTVACARNCPAGFSALVALGPAPSAGGGASSPPGSSLIPPPRDTTGIPVSKDAPPEEKRTPLPALLAAAALALAAGRRR